MNSDQILMTKEGYDKIFQEHEQLVSVKRGEVAERIKEAISYGDISENAEYDSAKNEQGRIGRSNFKAGKYDEKKVKSSAKTS